METEHTIVVGDARELSEIGDNTVELVVTSPPYPMIEMWDELFCTLDPRIETHLTAGEGQAAFERMHEVLNAVWTEVSRVLVDGGIACINIGDATRTLGGSFRVYQNHSRIIDAFEQRGFEPLPEILWRKPGNSAAKFMGSGMLPPNAYVTLEHEYILVFRNGPTSRQFEPKAESRYNAAYFWEERNRWFSDVWSDIRGELQALSHEDLRKRSGAYPFTLPYRLINMYSIYGDTVCDPFWGTGTTSLAAAAAGRNSVGYEIEPEFTDLFADRISDIPELSTHVIRTRLDAHRQFVDEKRAAGETFGHVADRYDFPVTTKQERPIKFYVADAVESTDTGYRISHSAVSDD